MSHEPAANGPHREHADLDVPPDFDPVPGEEPRPTDLGTPAQTRTRSEKLGDACDPWGWADNRGATLRTVRREP